MTNLALIPLLNATWQTIYMVFIASFFGILFGLLIGIILFLTSKNQSHENKIIHQTLGGIVNITRSIPFIILLISIIPLTRLLVGSSIGVNAAIVPLTLAAIPFYARIVQAALDEVPFGLLETAKAMGANTKQTVFKILIPESSPALIKGATLTIIGLIGYSAMAGAVGGGGLGELAINYGYQRFNITVMIETVILLVVLVQLIQYYGDKLAAKVQLKWIILICLFLWTASFAYQFWPVQNNSHNTIKVGIIAGAQEKILAIAKHVALKKYDLNLKVIPFNDYVQVNVALNNGSIDANIFQHVPYLNAQIKAHHYRLTPIAKTFVYPFGFYSKQIKKLSQLKDNAVVAIPNDPSNEGRALLLLARAKLIKLSKKAGLFATPESIMNNPKHLRFILLDAAQLPRVFKDASLVALTNDYIKPAGLTVNQALIKENANSPYANVIVVQTKDKTKPIFQELIKVMHSKPVLQATLKEYPDGAAIPAWRDS